jgi:hypothetical protein
MTLPSVQKFASEFRFVGHFIGYGTTNLAGVPPFCSNPLQLFPENVRSRFLRNNGNHLASYTVP